MNNETNTPSPSQILSISSLLSPFILFGVELFCYSLVRNETEVSVLKM